MVHNAGLRRERWRRVIGQDPTSRILSAARTRPLPGWRQAFASAPTSCARSRGGAPGSDRCTTQGRQRVRIGSSPGCTLVHSVLAAHTPASVRSQRGHRRYLHGSARAVGGRLAPLPVPAPGCRTRYRDPAYLPVPTTYPHLRVLPWGYVGARASSELRAFSSIPATHPMLRLFCLVRGGTVLPTRTPIRTHRLRLLRLSYQVLAMMTLQQPSLA
jgi:hypothetical protein